MKSWQEEGITIHKKKPTEPRHGEKQTQKKQFPVMIQLYFEKPHHIISPQKISSHSKEPQEHAYVAQTAETGSHENTNVIQEAKIWEGVMSLINNIL